MDVSAGNDERARFADLFGTTGHRVRGYVCRHVDAKDVDEVVSETYLTAWRRRERIDLEDPVPWLLVTARNIMSNRRRLGVRREMPYADLELVAAAVPSAEGPVVSRAVALAALATLTAVEREAVLLVAWDGLDRTAAALVAGCTVRAFTVRLQRARARLTRVIDAPTGGDDSDRPGWLATQLPTVVKELP